MGRLAGFSSRQVTRKLRRLGFEFDRQARWSSRDLVESSYVTSDHCSRLPLVICRKERYRRF